METGLTSKFQLILNENIIFIEENQLQNLTCEMAILSRPQCECKWSQGSIYQEIFTCPISEISYISVEIISVV